MHQPLTTLVSAAVISLLTANTAYSGAFSLYSESSVASMGNYTAGAAAEGADASIGWYNPAGLVLIKKQESVFGGIGVFPSIKMSGTSTFSTLGTSSYEQTYNDVQAGKNAFIPSFHYALPLGENFTFGLSAVSPFGLSTSYDNTSAVRYQATFSELITANISPEIGAKVTDHFSIGAGLDVQYSQVKFNAVIGAPTIFIPFERADSVDTLSDNNGNSVGLGFHAGIMAMFHDKHTRFGINYQSKMRHKFHGQSRLTGKLASPGLIVGDSDSVSVADSNAVFKSNELFSNPIEFPDILTLSAYHDINNTIALLGSFVYTGWSSFNAIQLNNVAAPSISTTTTQVSRVMINNTTTENYSDAWRVSLGANYRLNDLWMLRVGGGYDQTPTNDIYRDARTPDSSRWALALGAHYQMRPAIGMDIGYTHLFPAHKALINRTTPVGATSNFNVHASSKAEVDLIGAQLVWVMDK